MAQYYLKDQWTILYNRGVISPPRFYKRMIRYASHISSCTEMYRNHIYIYAAYNYISYIGVNGSGQDSNFGGVDSNPEKNLGVG